MDELVGFEQPTLRMLPTREPLVSDEHPSIQVDDGLDVRPDLAVAHCDRELVGERGNADVGECFVGDHLGAAHRLGARQRRVGPMQQRCGLVVARRDCETEADRGHHWVERSLDRHATRRMVQPLRELRCHVRFVEPVDQHDEFVAADACDGIARPHRGHRGASEAAQHVVADAVTEGVVDVLHRIHADRDRGNAAPVSIGTRERDADAVIEYCRAGQSGELVMDERGSRGSRAERRVDLAAVGDEPGHLTARSDTRDDRHRHRHCFARARQHCELTVPATGAQQRRPDLVVVAGERVRREKIRGREARRITYAQALPGGAVQVDHPALLVDDADQVRRAFDEREQLARYVGVVRIGRHGELPMSRMRRRV